MSSKGPTISGTDGRDFTHRQRVAEQYYISAQNKSRLKCCIFFQFIMFFIMLAKLSPDILDKFDIFILEIEELEIPKPLLWEYIWASSIIFTFVALTAIKKNRIGLLKKYLYGIMMFSCAPALYGAIYYYKDVWIFVNKGSRKNIALWRGYPYGVLWYIFILAVMQIHLFSLYFTKNLLSAWEARGSKKAQ